jgi:hypothetical protein
LGRRYHGQSLNRHCLTEFSNAAVDQIPFLAGQRRARGSIEHGSNQTARARGEGTTDQGCSNSGSARRPTKGLAQSAYRVAQSDGLPVQTRKAAGILVAAIRRITGQGSGKVTSVDRQGIIVGGHIGGVGCPESSLACCVQCETRGPGHQWPNLEINF